MESEAAICWEVGTEWTVGPIELDPPKAGEVLVEMAAAGLCHSDEHVLRGDLRNPLPLVGGHEGAGVVAAVGPGVEGLAEGDHVVFGFVPACGHCPSCARGRSSLCDRGATLMTSRQLDGTTRHHAGGRDAYAFMALGTFARHVVVNQMSCVRIAEDVPLDLACLVGCGVTTGWGSSVYAAEVRPGEDVAVLGVGGIGAAAIQGARMAGAARVFAVEPVTSKHPLARRFGATHTYASLDEATEAIRAETWGRMCDKVVCAIGLGQGSMMSAIMAITAKHGRVVVTNIHPGNENDVRLNLCDLTLMEKQIVGSLFGSANIRHDIPHLLQLYRLGQLDLDGMVTARYKLDDINRGYQDMRDGKNVRGVLVF